MERFFNPIRPLLEISLTTLGLAIATSQPGLPSSQRVMGQPIQLSSNCASQCPPATLLAQTSSAKTFFEQPLFLHLILMLCSGISTGLWLNSKTNLTKVRKKNHKLRQQIEILNAQIAALEALETQVANLREEIERKSQHEAQLRQNLKRLQSLSEEHQLEVYEAKNQNLQRKIESLNQEKERLETEFYELKTENREYEELFETYARDTKTTRQQISRLKQEKFDLENRKNWLQEENKRLEHQIVELVEQKSQKEKERAIVRDNLDFNNLEEVLDAADEDFDILRIWDTAKKSAEKECHQHFDFPGIYSALKAIAEVGTLSFDCQKHGIEIGHRWQEEFEKRGVTNYKPHESHATMRQYGHQRIFYHDGEKQKMTQHITFWNRDKAIQIFFIRNKKSKTMDIGYCGNHLDYDKSHT